MAVVQEALNSPWLVMAVAAYAVLVLLQERIVLVPDRYRYFSYGYSLAAGGVLAVAGVAAYPLGMLPFQVVMLGGVPLLTRAGVGLARRLYGRQVTGEVDDGIRAAGRQAEAPGAPPGAE